MKLFPLIAFLLAIRSNGHIRLTFPEARKYALDSLDVVRTVAPCGMVKGIPGSVVTEFNAGEKVNVSWYTSYAHQGGFRIDVLDALNSLKFTLTSPSLKFVNTGNGWTQNYEVILPTISCLGCTIRLSQKATDMGDNMVYMSCADVNIADKSLSGGVFMKASQSVYRSYGGDCPGPGNSLAGHDSCYHCTTFVSCANMCDGLIACVGFSWDGLKCFPKSADCTNPVINGFVFYKKESRPVTPATTTQPVAIVPQGYKRFEGDCLGFDIKHFDPCSSCVTVTECSGACTLFPKCAAFSWDGKQCYLKSRLCSTFYTHGNFKIYAKLSAILTTLPLTTEQNTTTALRTTVPITTVAPIKGYSALDGDCLGDPMAGFAPCRACFAIDDCIRICDTFLTECAGFSYDKLLCYLRTKVCSKPAKNGMSVFYARDQPPTTTSEIPTTTEAPLTTAVPRGYLKHSGDCAGHDLKGESPCVSCFTLSSCQALCDRKPDCMGFSWDGKMCLPKDASCTNHAHNGDFIFFEKIIQTTTVNMTTSVTNASSPSTMVLTTETQQTTAAAPDGYLKHSGDCAGHDLKGESPCVSCFTRLSCYALCDRKPDCMGFSWDGKMCLPKDSSCTNHVHNGGFIFFEKIIQITTINMTSDPPLVTNASTTAVPTTIIDIQTTVTEMMTTTVPNGYFKHSGDCGGHDLKGESPCVSCFTMSTCLALCDRKADCRGFSWDGKVCLPKDASCVNHAHNGNFIFYEKIIPTTVANWTTSALMTSGAATTNTPPTTQEPTLPGFTKFAGDCLGNDVPFLSPCTHCKTLTECAKLCTDVHDTCQGISFDGKTCLLKRKACAIPVPNGNFIFYWKGVLTTAQPSYPGYIMTKSECIGNDLPGFSPCNPAMCDSIDKCIGLCDQLVTRCLGFTWDSQSCFLKTKACVKAISNGKKSYWKVGPTTAAPSTAEPSTAAISTASPVPVGYAKMNGNCLGNGIPGLSPCKFCTNLGACADICNGFPSCAGFSFDSKVCSMKSRFCSKPVVDGQKVFFRRLSFTTPVTTAIQTTITKETTMADATTLQMTTVLQTTATPATVYVPGEYIEWKMDCVGKSVPGYDPCMNCTSFDHCKVFCGRMTQCTGVSYNGADCFLRGEGCVMRKDPQYLFHQKIISECGQGKAGNLYTGNKSTTAVGEECAVWSDQNLQIEKNLRNSLLINMLLLENNSTHDKCRNVAGKFTEPWCFRQADVGVPNPTGQTCGIPSCSHFCERSPTLCQNNAGCNDGVDSFKCICLPGTTGSYCEYRVLSGDCETSPMSKFNPCKACLTRFDCERGCHIVRECAGFSFDGHSCIFRFTTCKKPKKHGKWLFYEKIQQISGVTSPLFPQSLLPRTPSPPGPAEVVIKTTTSTTKKPQPREPPQASRITEKPPQHYQEFGSDCTSKAIPNYSPCAGCTTLENCWRACDKLDQCVGLSWNGASCYLRMKTCTKMIDNGYHFYVKNYSVAAYVVPRLSYDCRGHNMAGKDPCKECVAREDCETQCNIIDECVGYSWNSLRHLCFLKDSVCPQLTYSSSTLYYRKNYCFKQYPGDCPTVRLLRACPACSHWSTCQLECVKAETACAGVSVTGGVCLLRATSCETNQVSKVGIHKRKYYGDLNQCFIPTTSTSTKLTSTTTASATTTMSTTSTLVGITMPKVPTSTATSVSSTISTTSTTITSPSTTTTKPPDDGRYKEYGADCPHYNMDRFDPCAACKSLENCEAACDVFMECIGISWDGSECYLKKKKCIKLVKNGKFIFYEKIFSKADFVVPVRGTNCPLETNNIKDMAPCAECNTFEKCQYQCSLISTCHAMSWNPTQQKCFLKDSVCEVLKPSTLYTFYTKNYEIVSLGGDCVGSLKLRDCSICKSFAVCEAACAHLGYKCVGFAIIGGSYCELKATRCDKKDVVKNGNLFFSKIYFGEKATGNILTSKAKIRTTKLTPPLIPPVNPLITPSVKKASNAPQTTTTTNPPQATTTTTPPKLHPDGYIHMGGECPGGPIEYCSTCQTLPSCLLACNKTTTCEGVSWFEQGQSCILKLQGCSLSDMRPSVSWVFYKKDGSTIKRRKKRAAKEAVNSRPRRGASFSFARLDGDCQQELRTPVNLCHSCLTLGSCMLECILNKTCVGVSSNSRMCFIRTTVCNAAKLSSADDFHFYLRLGHVPPSSTTTSTTTTTSPLFNGHAHYITTYQGFNADCPGNDIFRCTKHDACSMELCEGFCTSSESCHGFSFKGNECYLKRTECQAKRPFWGFRFYAKRTIPAHTPETQKPGSTRKYYEKLVGDCHGNEFAHCADHSLCTLGYCEVLCNLAKACLGFSWKPNECFLKAVACLNPLTTGASEFKFYAMRKVAIVAGLQNEEPRRITRPTIVIVKPRMPPHPTEKIKAPIPRYQTNPEKIRRSILLDAPPFDKASGPTIKVVVARKCSNNGQLVNNACQCNRLFSGQYCQYKDDCATSQDCSFRGQCIVINSAVYPSKVCYCSSGSFGRFCQFTSAITKSLWNPSGYNKFSPTPDFNIYYKFIWDTKQLDIHLEAKTTSWLAIGWRPLTFDRQCQWDVLPYGLMPLPPSSIYGGEQKRQTTTSTTTTSATTPKQVNGYTKLEGDCPGYDMIRCRQFFRCTLQFCQNICNIEKTCVGLSYSKNECFLKTRTCSVLTPGWGHKFYLKADRTANATTPNNEAYQALSGDCPGNDIADCVDSFFCTLSNCKRLCSAIDGCVGFSWKANECFFKSLACATPQKLWGHNFYLRATSGVTESSIATKSSTTTTPTGAGQRQEYTYRQLSGDCPGNDLPELACASCNFEQCKALCNKSVQCTGFSWKANECFPKNVTCPTPQHLWGHQFYAKQAKSSTPAPRRKRAVERLPRSFQVIGLVTNEPADKIHPMSCTDVIMGSAVGDLHRVDDYYSRDSGTPLADTVFGGTTDLVASTGWEVNGWSHLWFRTALSRESKGDNSVRNAMMHVIWARGQASGIPVYGATEMPMYHGGLTSNRGSLKLNFFEAGPPLGSCGSSWKYPSGCNDQDCSYVARWAYDQLTDVITFTVRTTDSSGKWIGIGFSADSNMANSDMYLGWVTSTGKATVRDYWAYGRSVPQLDQKQNILQSSGTFLNGVTTIRFTRRRTTGDARDQQFGDTNSQCYYFLFPVQPGTYDIARNIITKHATKPVVSPTKICIRKCDTTVPAFDTKKAMP